MTEKLKRCPFCGGEAEVRQFTASIQFVQCRVCLAHSATFETDTEAIRVWNKRYSLLSLIKGYFKELMKSWLEA